MKKEMKLESDLKNLTNAMHRLEIEIVSDQKYLLRWEEHNDKNPDEQWLQFKESAKYNLTKLDEMKILRDSIKNKLKI